jgi:hypothetical protein
VQLTSTAATAIPRAYIRCLRFPNARFDRHAAAARQSEGWQYRELDCSHHAPVTHPDDVTALLIDLAS